MSVVTALGISIGWLLYTLGLKATDAQADALGILIFPFVHLAFIRLGVYLDKQEPKDRRPGDKINGEAKEPVK